MRRKIYLAILAAFLLLTGIFIWRLDIPSWKKLDISLLNDIPASTIVYGANGEAAGSLYGMENRTLISIESVPQHVKNAFIAAEDARFYSHSGVDVRRMLGAMLQNIRSMEYAQGASTITQQLIKLTHLTSEKKISRKVQEIFLALKLEKVMEKDEILECYLNTVYFGRGAYGISAAAKTYFGKEANELTLPESALLAGIIKSPSGYAPHINPDKSVSRRNSILSAMAENGFITESEASAAREEPLSITEDQTVNTDFGWYMDCVLGEAEGILNCGSEDILSGGYHIYTGLDPDMQTQANKLFSDSGNFPTGAADGTPVQASLIAVDPATGEVRAVTGGREYEVRRGLNRATQIKRQPGSVFKPISVFAAAVDAYHFVPSSTIEDTPRSFAGGYTPGNAGGASYGTVTLREALSRSLNIATVDLADLIGIDSVQEYSERFGIELSGQDQNLSLALGFLTDGISPMDISGAYSALANGGVRVEPHFIRSIWDASGKELYNASAPESRIIKESTAFLITDMLKTAAESGSAKALSSAGIPVAGKTGTIEHASGGTRDIWTVGYTPDVAVTVWMGYDMPDDDHVMPSSEGGSGYPARLCAEFIRGIAPCISGRDFDIPGGVSAVMIDKLALENDHAVRLITDNTPDEFILKEYFHTGSIPTLYSENWARPESITDLRLVSTPGETPVIEFTATSDHSEYVILRESDGRTTEVAVASGAKGYPVRFTDTAHDLSYPARYTVIPRNKYLFERGEILNGDVSDPVSYSPGGILGSLKNADADNTAPAQDNYDVLPDQSLLG